MKLLASGSELHWLAYLSVGFARHSRLHRLCQLVMRRLFQSSATSMVQQTLLASFLGFHILRPYAWLSCGCLYHCHFSQKTYKLGFKTYQLNIYEFDNLLQEFCQYLHTDTCCILWNKLFLL